jgi:hypothetical protein
MRLSRKKIITRLNFWVTDREIEEWANNKNIFFILAIGRSGTKFLADLLNKAPDACVVHEPVKDDFQAYQEAFHSEEKAKRYIQGFRKKEIYLRVRNQPIHSYGEVNSVLRRHCYALKEAFPNATFVHLVRDGRDVVRSMMSRKTMTADDPNTRRIYPKRGDPWRDKWPEMSRFERLCWYWQVENRYLRSCIKRTVQLERIVSSYEYFSDEVLKPLNLEIPEGIWQEAVKSPKNVTREYKLPHWSEWEQEKVAAFWRICGDEMKANGYDFRI